MYAAPLEERAEHEQHHGVGGGAYLFYGGKQRLGQTYAEQLERNAHDRAEDERIFENVYDDAEGVWPFAAEQLKCYHCNGVEHRNDDGDQHDDRACVRAGDESRRKRQTDYDKIRAVNALDLNAALGGALFGKHDVTEGERILGKDACGREYEQLRLHRAGKIRGVDVVKQHHRHEIAKQKPVELGNVLALNSAQMPCKASERHDEKYRNDRV